MTPLLPARAPTPVGGKLLFISHNASRTGAPILLLHFLKWLRANTDSDFEILLRDGGELEKEFEALARTTVFNRQQTVADGLSARIGNRVGWNRLQQERQQNAILQRLFKTPFDLVYSNTITNGALMAKLAPLGCPMLCHVHELEYVIRQVVRPESLGKVLRHTTHYIAASEAVRQNLINKHNIPRKKIDVVHEFICTPASANNRNSSRSEARHVLGLAALGIPKDAFLVGAAGGIQWRKGPDLFVQLARASQTRLPAAVATRTFFLWMGGGAQMELKQLQYDLRQCGLAERVLFLGERADPEPFFAALDVFALVSREDPYPLVALEAAAAGNPIVGFNGSGGAPELVETDCGFTVAYLDVESMADKTRELLCDENLRTKMGARAAAKVRERHDLEVGAPQLQRVINHLIANS